ncbi:MAG: zinc ribbon domain-containing protein [Cyanobacteria bacterium]|nr:zinc ribbon domain-containing protein [Cyanobacteriota bacterium]MDA0865927.1 zinc ribbon domain-containing protein [Cyanobacteriota bacterium]
MLRFIRRVSRRFLRKSTQIHHEPINKISIVILILIDIFVLLNVFGGLASISQWPLSPTEQFSCLPDYVTFHEAAPPQDLARLRANLLDSAIAIHENPPYSPLEAAPRLGKVDPICQTHQQLQAAVATPDNLTRHNQMQTLRVDIATLEEKNRVLKAQYDSTLLENIAGQDPAASINESTAAGTKAEIEANQQQIEAKQGEVTALEAQLIESPAGATYLEWVEDRDLYDTLRAESDQVQFWHPNQVLGLQILFLTPLIAVAYGWHRLATRRQWGLQALLSWHLLLIVCLPLVVRLFEFIQFGNVVSLVVEAIVAVLGGLLFLASYLLIAVIPLLGFALIKLLQRFVFNPKVQAKNRIQNGRCIRCSAKLRSDDAFCPYCGFGQYQTCGHCHQPTYKYTPHCHHCGSGVGEGVGEGVASGGSQS